jgi:segregation and condensation protein B
MLNDETLKSLLEGIIYIAPEPVTLDGMMKVLEGEERERVKAKLDELVADYEQNTHGIQIRQVANGYKFSTKAEHHEILRKYVKSLKAPVKLSKPALETLAVIAYRQPVTMPEIEEVRGVDSGGVIHTLLEKKLVVTSGRKNVVGRPILYRTSKDFLVQFGLKDLGELPSLKEFEELAKRALGAEWTAEEGAAGAAESDDAGALQKETSELTPETPVQAALPMPDAEVPAEETTTSASAPEEVAENVNSATEETPANAGEESAPSAESPVQAANPEDDLQAGEPATELTIPEPTDAEARAVVQELNSDERAPSASHPEPPSTGESAGHSESETLSDVGPNPEDDEPKA